jgi:hypothetical protein
VSGWLIFWFKGHEELSDPLLVRTGHGDAVKARLGQGNGGYESVTVGGGAGPGRGGVGFSVEDLAGDADRTVASSDSEEPGLASGHAGVGQIQAELAGGHWRADVRFVLGEDTVDVRQ